MAKHLWTAGALIWFVFYLQDRNAEQIVRSVDLAWCLVSLLARRITVLESKVTA